MATRNQNIAGGLIGFAVGAIVTYNRVNQKNKYRKKEEQESPWPKTLLYGSLTAIGGICISELIGTPNDAVNYTQLDTNGKIVYHGITGKHRVAKRMQEHVRSGKVFADVEVSNPLPRVDARRIELKRIKMDTPKYNIQDNPLFNRS